MAPVYAFAWGRAKMVRRRPRRVQRHALVVEVAVEEGVSVPRGVGADARGGFQGRPRAAAARPHRLLWAAALVASARADGGACCEGDMDCRSGASLRGAGAMCSLDPVRLTSCVKDCSSPWLVEFYSTMCASCQAFEPTWTQLSMELKRAAGSRLILGRFDIDPDGAMSAAMEEGVLSNGVPAIVLYPGKGRPWIPVYFAQGGSGEDTIPSADELRNVVLAKYSEALGSPLIPMEAFLNGDVAEHQSAAVLFAALTLAAVVSTLLVRGSRSARGGLRGGQCITREGHHKS
mmetsp:Transcript_54657/g.158741  ORF Transcript_54657/g.158741 Transcript_54657/m.158741 type:complete len:290 (-) Transcript_54657:7-876(-)